jgi:hypothetical protein
VSVEGSTSWVVVGRYRASYAVIFLVYPVPVLLPPM